MIHDDGTYPVYNITQEDLLISYQIGSDSQIQKHLDDGQTIREYYEKINRKLVGVWAQVDNFNKDNVEFYTGRPCQDIYPEARVSQKVYQ